MKAVLATDYGSPEVLKLAEVEKPVPKDDEILIKVHAATAMPGDCEIRRFDMHVLFWIPVRIIMGIVRPKQPILGLELAGEVEKVGSKVTQFKKGDKVYSITGLKMGAYAQYKCQRAKFMTALIPSGLSYEEAATLPTGGVNALHYMRLANINKDDKVLINGASGCFGIYAIQIAKLFGAKVTAVDRSDKLEILTELGADKVIAYDKEDFTANRSSYDVVFDVIGTKSPWKIMKSLRPKGRYVLATPWVFQVIKGTFSALFKGRKFRYALAGEKTEDMEYIRNLVNEGKLKTVIGKTFPLEQLAEAHRYVESKDKIGHVAITIDHNT